MQYYALFMPFRDPDDVATRIQATIRGWLTRQRRRYPCVYFPPRPITPNSRRYRAPAYRNNEWVYWDRQQYLDHHCGLELEYLDCVEQGGVHPLHPPCTCGEACAAQERYCDWCSKDILLSNLFSRCSSCSFDVCNECMEYALENRQSCDLWRFIRLVENEDSEYDDSE